MRRVGESVGGGEVKLTEAGETSVGRHDDTNTVLPDGWEVVSLCEVVEPSREKAEPGERDNAPYLSLEHIESETTRISGQGLGSEVLSTKNVFRAGDVLYGKLRPYLNKVCM